MSGVQYFQLFVVLVLLSVGQARVFSRCELAKTLLNYQIPRDQLATWVCLAEHESSRDTAAVGPPNLDGSQEYGLFQINSRYWCSGGPASEVNQCNIPCQSLTNDDISDDVQCAKLILRRQGFATWATWYMCSGNVSSYIDNCAGL